MKTKCFTYCGTEITKIDMIDLEKDEADYWRAGDNRAFKGYFSQIRADGGQKDIIRFARECEAKIYNE